MPNALIHASARPRFRTDLVAQPLELDGYRFIDVTDPDTEQTFRFYEVEYSVACAMDGARDVPGLIRWSQEELGLEPSPDEVVTVIDTLADLGYLAAEDIELGGAGTDLRPPAPVRGPGVELGQPGASAMGEPRAATAGPPADVQLGAPGGTSRARGVGGDESFAGLMDESAALGPAGGTSDLAAPLPALSPPPRARTGGFEPAAPAPPALAPPAFAPAPPSPAPPAPAPAPAPAPPARQAPVAVGRPRQRTPAPTPPEYSNEDVSVDLSDHLSIGTADLQEAVRQSQVIQVPTLPEEAALELGDEPASPGLSFDGLDDAPAADDPVDAGREPAVTATAAAARFGPGSSFGNNEVFADEPPGRGRGRATGEAPIAFEAPPMPRAAAAVEPEPEPELEPELDERVPDEPAAHASGGAALWVALLVLFLACAAAAYYFLIYAPNQAADSLVTSALAPPAPAAPAAATEAPASATLVESAPEQTEVTAGAGGEIDWLISPGMAVQEGDLIAKLDGWDKVEASLSRPRRKLEEYSASLQKYEQAGSASGVKRYAAKVEEKRLLVAAAEAELAKRQVLAPMPGTVELAVEQGWKIAAGDLVCKILGEPGLEARFERDGADMSVDGPCQVASAKMPAKRIACEVTAVEGDAVTVRIPRDIGLAGGELVILQP